MFSWMSARFSASDRGASAVEYGLIVFAIAAVVIVAVFAFGTVTEDMFTESCATLRTQTAVSATCT